jgi:hypothetical protein
MSSEKIQRKAGSDQAGAAEKAGGGGQPAVAEPHQGARTRADMAARAERLAAEMRKNLLNRKLQRRAVGQD